MATFVLMHGFWHDGTAWEIVIDILRSRGQEDFDRNVILSRKRPLNKRGVF